MAVSKKYAGLPDLDPAPEIYETPELTDDASTVQTSTLRTLSPSPSEEGRHDPDTGLDRQHIDRDQARRRFEPAVIDARDVDFSDTVAGGRKSYKTRRRKRPRRKNGAEETEYSSDSEDETISSKIARLQREAEEVRLELEQREEGEFKEAVESQGEEQENGMAELSRILDGLRASAGGERASTQEELLKARLTSGPGQPPDQALVPQNAAQGTANSETSPSTLAAIAAFSDRLTALEASLGISAVSSTDETAPVLPTLASLTTQITTLSSTLTPNRAALASSTSSQPLASPLPTLDALASRVRTLTAETDKLTLSRKAALQSLTDLHDARLRHSSTTPSYSHHNHLASRPNSQHQHQNQPSPAETEQQKLHAQLFLDEQSAKISALYHTLPTIQSLSPLLPVMLERLRSLSVVHAGAAEARTEMDEVERRQGEIGKEIEKWRSAVQGVEEQMKEMQEVMKGNVEVVGGMVKDVEEKVKRLEGKS